MVPNKSQKLVNSWNTSIHFPKPCCATLLHSHTPQGILESPIDLNTHVFVGGISGGNPRTHGENAKVPQCKKCNSLYGLSPVVLARWLLLAVGKLTTATADMKSSYFQWSLEEAPTQALSREVWVTGESFFQGRDMEESWSRWAGDTWCK